MHGILKSFPEIISKEKVFTVGGFVTANKIFLIKTLYFCTN